MIISIDPAFSTDKDSDDASIAVVGRHLITNQRYLFDLYAGTSAPSVTINYAFMFLDTWTMNGFNISKMSVETVNINKRQEIKWSLLTMNITVLNIKLPQLIGTRNF